MSAEDFASTVRSAPGWLIVLIAIVTVIALIGAGPFAGWVVVQRRHRETSIAMAVATGRPSPEMEEYFRATKTEPISRAYTRPFGALDVTFVDSSPTTLVALLEPATEPVPLSEEPTEPQPIVEPLGPISEPLDEPTEENPVLPTGVDLPQWATMTAEYDIVSVLEAEVVEAEDEATKLFRADPLRSWVEPPLEEYDYLPEADRVFRDLVARNWLTGEGAEISAEWEPWYADSRELEGASAS